MFPFFFFFQAEDGIRDIGVTGVQTCALPIWLHFGLLFFWKALPMHSGGPITLGNTAPDGFALAHYFSRRLCQCTPVGPSHLEILLLMALLWPIISLFCATNALEWAHYIG